MLDRLAGLAAELRATAADAVARHWEADPASSRFQRLALYASTGHEMPMRPLYERARGLGRHVLWPRIEAERLVFAPCSGWEDLVPGRYGVPAPPETFRAEPLASDALVLVPGVAFDEQGHRLGRGGGYYDRVLSGAGGATPVGVAFDCQIVEEVPVEPHDRRVAGLLTESGFRRIGT